MFPISDDDRHLLKPAWVTIAILIGNVLLYLYQTTNDSFTLGWSAVPWEITNGKDLVGNVPVNGGGLIPLGESPAPVYLTLLSSMFVHGGLMHLGGNMLYLWIFGDNLEHRFGALRFLFFYLVSGLVGTIAHIALAPDSVIPMLGASGAISGILGAYIVLFPWNKVNAIFFFRMVTLPAILVIGVWAGMQVLGGWGTLAKTGQSGGVAYAAHIGGFVAGVVTGLLSRMLMKSEPDTVFKQQSIEDPTSRRLW
ncbi:MAG: rhomboid family intramembrane serine protease [Verrucomicrobiaceae bacterium]|nr:MAG: rhomboid family intramembrane serine protease [Verrucomicrobiaceae bacterium]